MIEPSFTYQFIGERLCLDFCNTGENREGKHVAELLGSYDALLHWSQQAHLLTPDEVIALQQASADHPEAANAVYQQAISLREALYRLFSALAGQRPPSPDDAAILNGTLAEAMCHRRVELTETGFDWGWEPDILSLDQMLWHVALSAAELLVSPEVARLRECGNGNCSWLFLDLSRNHSRRWCTMEACGNRVKARRFRHRENKPRGKLLD